MRAVEIERRRAKLDQIRRASDLDEDQQKLWAQGDSDRAARGGEALEFLERLRALRERPLPSRRTLIRQVPQLGAASLGTHGRTEVRADRPDGAFSCEISSAIGEHRQVATEVRLTSEPAAYQCVPHGAESGALVVRRTRSRGRPSAAAGRRARGQEG